ncbi:MAG: hypothetical protein J5953_00870 [Prevotella sp.]|nr:hypothetical protein [Prevotella sp.]
MEEILTVEQMQQRSDFLRKRAKEMERRLRNVTEPEARKIYQRAISNCYALAKNQRSLAEGKSKLRDVAKRCRKMAESIGREHNSDKANQDDD